MNARRGSRIRFAKLAALVVFGQAAFAQELAAQLATPELRDEALHRIARSGGGDLRSLLSWSEAPPDGLDVVQLNIGLAEAFGKLRAKEAIPFLMRNILLDVSGLDQPNIWLKAEGVIETRLPAVVALIDIGPEASKALVATPWAKIPLPERLATVFVVSRIADPSARDFLSSIKTTLPQEAFWAREGLQRIDAKSSEPRTR